MDVYSFSLKIQTFKQKYWNILTISATYRFFLKENIIWDAVDAGN